MSSNATPGTLSEMDMILCVTQRAINKQFQVLYNTPLEKDPENFLIDHVLKIGYTPRPNPFDPDHMIPGDTGITAWIGSPLVDFTDIDSNSIPNRSLRFTIPLKGGWIDMVEGGIHGRILYADWKISWMVSLGSKDIQNLEEEVTHPEARSTIQAAIATSGVPSEDFLPSSLFCLFEADQIANTFQMTVDPQFHGVDKRHPAIIASEDPENPLAQLYQRDVNGNLVGLIMDDPRVGTGADMVKEFMLGISNTFSQLGKDPTNPNPYVLGYPITQKIPAPVDAIPALVPAKFEFSTTPWSDKNEIDPQKLNLATLNFCMLGFGPHDDALTNVERNSMAGVIAVPYGQVTRQGPSTDGILAFSRNEFCADYIVKILASKFVIYPTKWNTPLTIDSDIVTPDHSALSSYSRVINYTYGYADHEEVFDWRRTQYSGTNSLNMVWSSTLTDDPTNPLSDDSKREMTIKINGHVHINIHVQTTVKGPAGGKDGDGAWNDGGNYWADAYYDATLRLTTGSDGAWNFVPSLEAQVINLPRDANGNVKYTADHHLEGWVAFTDWLGSLMFDFMGNYFTGFLKLTITPTWFDNINSAMKTLNTRVIMPAGDVFEFKGLDTDTVGNVYTHLMYKTILGGERL